LRESLTNGPDCPFGCHRTSAPRVILGNLFQAIRAFGSFGCPLLTQQIAVAFAGHIVALTGYVKTVCVFSLSNW